MKRELGMTYMAFVKQLVRRWPLPRGARRFSHLMGLSADTLPAEQVVESVDGRRFVLKADGMYYGLYVYGEYSPQETRMFRRLVEPGQVVGDIGANFGWFTTLFAQLVGPSGAVHAFEPSPTTYRECRINLALNELDDRVTLNSFGLGTSEEARQLFSFGGLPHGHNSFSDLGRDDARGEEVIVRRLDDYASAHAVERFHLLKIDVEGAELEVLRGAGAILEDSERAPLVVIETNDETTRAMGYSAIDLLNHLTDCGYDEFRRDADGSFELLPTLDAYRHGDMIVCSKSGIHEVR